MEIEVLMNKKKNAAAAYIRAECCRSSTPETLKMLLDTLLDPQKRIDNDSFELIEWIKWVMAGGCSPEEFTANVRKYDNATTCGLVWTANFVAYRCRTCGISPCMSLCAECFQRGNHTGHDFNMFRSQAGGACDCGDMNVMKESGFCYLHGPHSRNSNPSSEGPNAAPPDLLCVASQMMPRLILRLIQHMRDNSNSLSGFLGSVQDADGFISMLYEMSGMGAAMRQVMTYALTNPQIYKNLTDVDEIDASANPAYYEYMKGSKYAYVQALRSLPNPKPPPECIGSLDTPALVQELVHRTFLEEFVFWTAKFEFPQKIVCLLLNLLPDEDYKEAFTRAFVLHYGRISQLLVQSTDPDMLSNRVVHVSVQLFSNEKLALRMAEQMGLLHVMVMSLTYMMNKITVPSSLSSDGGRNEHLVVDCGNQCMKDHCYWPLVSDLNNILSHRPVAIRFLQDDNLINMWFNFLSLFQGMNTNQRELHQHVEYEPTTYYAAFSTELEASASPMWALVSHLRDASTAHLTKNLINICKEHLNNWFTQIGFNGYDLDDDQVSFHLPLHRYLSVFVYQGVRNQGLSLDELLPSPAELSAIIQHPLRVQTGFYEIISGLWVRNGLQIKGQAMTYVQCHFCNSMVDADLFLLQVSMMNLPYHEFLLTVINRFNVMESLSISETATNSSLDTDHEILMLENCLIFLATLACVRTSIGVSDSDLVSLEMVTLLCMGDKTHSQLMELMPERCGNSSQSKDFEHVLSQVADYRAPNFEHGNMVQGMYVPKHYVWETLYDPIYILLRAVHRKDFQTSLDRFTDFVKQTGKFKGTPWPPFRIPQPPDAPYKDPRLVLHSQVLHGLIFVVFFKAIKGRQSSDQLVSLAVYLLELALSVTEPIGEDVMLSMDDEEEEPQRFDMAFNTWFHSDSLLTNVRTPIQTVLAKRLSEDEARGSDSSDDNIEDGMDIDIFSNVQLYEVRNPRNNTTPTFVNVNRHPNNLPITHQERLRLPPVRALMHEGTIRGHSRDDEMRRRNLQMVIHSPKPILKAHKKGVGVYPITTDAATAVEVPVGESIISLLLKLHAKLSSCPDSYTPYWQTPIATTIMEETKGGVNTGLDPSILDTQSQSPLFYSQLYNVMRQKEPYKSRIGDGPFFIANVLDKMASMDPSCRQHILDVKERLWPREMEAEEAKEVREAEEEAERKKRASERRRQATEEMQRRQQAFLEKMKSEMADGGDPYGEGEADGGIDEGQKMKAVEYHCVICNLTGPSTPSNPVGLVILLQATSVLGHRWKKDSPVLMLPTSEEERCGFLACETMSDVNERRLVELSSHFDDDSWLMGMSGGWDGGVHVQTCGHHLHHDCFRDYHTSLRTQQRQHNISIDRGEYFCPLCRQLANSFLPLSSEFGVRQSALVRDRSGDTQPLETTIPQIPPWPEATVALEILKLLKEYPMPTEHSKMVDAMAKTMEEMTNATSLKYRKIGSTTNTKSILLFVNSIARTNLELELVLLGGTLVSTPTEPKPSTSTTPPLQPSSKRSCIVPLLHVLGVHYKILSTDQCLPKTWERILGIRFLPDTQVITPEREVSLLLRDPIATLLHFLMNLPMHVDSAYFDCMVQALYNHVYIQALVTVSSRMGERERGEWKGKKSLFCGGSEGIHSTQMNQLEFLLGTVITNLGNFGDSDADMDSSPTSRNRPKDGSFELNEDEVENEVEAILLPFLRIATLLRHHLYDHQLPFVPTLHAEFPCLGQYLRLGLSQPTRRKPSFTVEPFKAHHFLFWISPTPLKAIWTWCADLANFVGRSPTAARFLLNTQTLSWALPRILDLPYAYDGIFQYYHRRQCPKCNLVPKDPSICLLCATMVCLRDSCCKQQNIFEATQHALNCGAGTAMYLSVNSSTIVVIRGKRACLWGSVYLDSFGEEDRELKRGKPLFLSRERYALLQQQWLTHRFDHSPRKWIFHREAL